MKRRSVAIRCWREEDTEVAAGDWEEAWRTAGLSPAPITAGNLAVAGRGAILSAITLDGELGGFLATVTDSRRLVVAAIALWPRLRGWGYGSEAVGLLERAAERPLAALAASANGLALYFWLRLGYRPSERQPWRPEALLLEKDDGRQGNG